MRLDHGLCLTNLRGREADVHSQVYAWCEPEFCLAVRVRDMHVNASLFPREEEQTELAVTGDGWCHDATVAARARDRVSAAFVARRYAGGCDSEGLEADFASALKQS